MELDLIGPNEKGLSVTINNQESLNCYEMAAPKSRSGKALVGSPGTALFSTIAGVPRGAIEMAGAAYVLMNTTLYSVDSAGTATSLGTVTGSDRVSMTHDGNSVIIVNGTTTGYYYSVSGGLTTVTLPYAAYTVTMLDTYALFTGSGRRFFISAVGDTDNIDALDFAYAQKSPKDLLAVIEDHGEALMFKEDCIEPWYNTGNVDFPFELNKSGIVERGLYARFALAKDDNSVMFLGDDLIVYRLDGYSPVRVSGDSEEIQLADIKRAGNDADLRDAFAFFYTDHGHKFFQLTVPNQTTLVFDLATQRWHKKKHLNLNTHHAWAYVNCHGKHLIAGVFGNLYEMSRSYYNDAGTVMRRLRRTSTYAAEDRLIHWKAIRFIFEFGTTTYNTGSDADPRLVVRFSRDDGRTYGNEKRLTLGRTGQYLAKAIKRNCGSERKRLIEFSLTADVPFICLGAYADLS